MAATKKPTTTQAHAKKPAPAAAPQPEIVIQAKGRKRARLLPVNPETLELLAPFVGLSAFRLRRLSRIYPDFPKAVFITGQIPMCRHYYDPQAVIQYVNALFDSGREIGPRSPV